MLSSDVCRNGRALPRLYPLASDRPPLTLIEARSVLRRFPKLGSVGEWVWRRQHPYYSAVGIIETAGGRVVIKRHHALVRNVQCLSEEHRFIAHLRAQGLPVSEVLADASGATAILQGDWTYEVHRVAPGVDLYRDAIFWTPFISVAHAHAAGCALAQLHIAAGGFRVPPRCAKMLVANLTIFASRDPIARMEAFIRDQPILARFFAKRHWREAVRRTLLPFHAPLLPLLQALSPLWTHNDWHASNLIWSGTRTPVHVTAILDFGLSGQSYALCDIAIAIERNVIGWRARPFIHSGRIHLDLLDAFLSGYESLKPLTDAEVRGLPLLLPLVHTELALSEIAYFNGVAGAPEKAEMVYKRYFLGHAAWFKRAAGQALCAHLKQRY